jgi:hypothetical protein
LDDRYEVARVAATEVARSIGVDAAEYRYFHLLLLGGLC